MPFTYSYWLLPSSGETYTPLHMLRFENTPSPASPLDPSSVSKHVEEWRFTEHAQCNGSRKGVLPSKRSISEMRAQAFSFPFQIVNWPYNNSNITHACSATKKRGIPPALWANDSESSLHKFILLGNIGISVAVLHIKGPLLGVLLIISFRKDRQQGRLHLQKEKTTSGMLLEHFGHPHTHTHIHCPTHC